MEEESYQIEAIDALCNNYSPEHFRVAIGECRDVIAKLTVVDNNSDQQIARVRILTYLDLQLARAVRWAEQETDLMALVVRSQIELRFWADFVSKGEAEASRFLHEADIDARELHEKMEKFAPGDVLPLAIKIPGSRVSVTRLEGTEDLAWKLCSKLIHPSSLVLNSPELSLFSEEYQKFLAICALFYGWGIITRFHEINWTTPADMGTSADLE